MSFPRPLLTSITAVALLTAVTPAFADCSDFAGPGVYWRRCVQDGQNLQGVDLTGAVLRDGSFKRADLTGADLSGVDARRAKFVSATLKNATLDAARLVQSDLTTADLTGASLRDADLTRAKLFRADLRGADLTGAQLDDIDLLKAQLGGATWIDGKTICDEESVGQCHPARKKPSTGEVEASG
ncbi:MAG TPA: pentapeptide repeat-containing protein [Geminicoccaceae bacterium]